MKRAMVAGIAGIVALVGCESAELYVGEVRSALPAGQFSNELTEQDYVINGGFLFNYANRGYFAIDTDDTCTPEQLSNDYLQIGSYVAFEARVLEKNVLEIESCPEDVSSRNF